MNSQDRVERVLKEMHVAFSNGPSISGQPDKIVLDRRKFLNLLDRLSKGIYDMMDEYEHTQQSRAAAEREFRRQGDMVIEEANNRAEDVYAASVIYTADAIGYIRDLMDRTNASMDELFREFRRELRERKDVLRSNELELQSQLADMADTRKYLSVIEDINRERNRRNRDEYAGKETGYRPDAGDREEFAKRNGQEADDAKTGATTAEKPEVIVNKDSAYFKWKESQEKDEDPDTVQEAPKEAAPETVDDAAPGEEESKKKGRADSRSHVDAGKILKNLLIGKD